MLAGAADEKSVAEAVRKAGGTVTVDDKSPDKPVIFVHFDDKRARKLTDEDVAKLVPDLAVFGSLKGVDCARRKISDSTLLLICKTLPELQELGLNDAAVTDDGLKSLPALKKLETLRLNDATAITDDGIRTLSKISSLKSLGLDRTKITDDGMKAIKNLSHLKELRITDTAVTDAGLRELKNLSTLEYVYALKSKISKDGAAELKKALPSVYVAGP
jgi:hypothetical protein